MKSHLLAYTNTLLTAAGVAATAGGTRLPKQHLTRPRTTDEDRALHNATVDRKKAERRLRKATTQL